MAKSRKKMRKSVDKKVFRRTAKHIAAANLSSGVYRGGIRL